MLDAKLQKQMEQFYESWQRVDRLYAEYAKTAGLTYPGLEVLEILYEAPEGCTQKLICEKTHYPKQSVNTIVKDLWQKGYAQLREIETDRRNKTVRLTQKGREFADRIVGDFWQAEEHAMALLTAEQRQVMLDSISQIEQSLREKLKL